MEVSIGIILFIVFLIFALLMFFNKISAILALPLMAVSLSLIAGIPFYLYIQKQTFSLAFISCGKDIVDVVLTQGAYRLHLAIFTVIFGAILSQVISKSGIAETMIKSAAELAGDKPLVISLVLTAVISMLFVVLGGLGAVIMVATIVFPIMLSIGIDPLICGCLFLLGLSLGGTFNLINWQLYKDVLLLSQEEIVKFAIPLGVVFAIIIFAFIMISFKKGGKVRLADAIKEVEKKKVSGIALLTPLVPLLLVISFTLYNILFEVPEDKRFNFPIISAMIVGIIYGILTTRKKGVSSLNILTKASIVGIQDVAPAVVLMIGIGMLLNSVMSDAVRSYMSPLLEKVLPHHALSYVLFFTLLAPLALYRGPFNLWGMGSGIVGIMVTTKALPPEAIMAALMSVGMIQGVCDPTNTHNVWIANYLNIDVQEILKRTLPYVWILALIGLIIAARLYF